MLGTPHHAPQERKLRIHDVSDVLSILARANRWTAYFALLARCEVDVPAHGYDARKRQAIRVVDVAVTEGK